MKVKKKIILFAAILLLITGVVLFITKKSGQNSHFLRLHFNNQNQLKKSLTGQGKKNQEPLRGLKYSTPRVIPGTTRGNINGEKTFVLKPGLTGKKRILFNISIKYKKKQKAKINIVIVRNKKILLEKKLQSTRKGKISHLFSDILNFKPEDIIKITATGEGKIILNDALFYDIIKKKEREYIFLIALDNIRYDKLGKKNNGIALTPNLNELLNDSVNFQNAFAQSSWTLPSFTSFFTGLYEFNHAITIYSHLDPTKPFLTENFAKHYITVSIHGGVWLGGKNYDYRGFDYYKFGSHIKNIHASKQLFDNVIDFINKNQIPNLLMFLHTGAIHAPFNPPKDFLLKLNKNPPFYKHKTFVYRNQYKADVPKKTRLAMEELYEADIAAFDHHLGNFLKFLKNEGIYKKSLIVFFSDHGEEFFDHKGWFHGHSMYNEIIKVPLLIKFPDNTYGGTIIPNNCGIIDILPTLMDYLKIRNQVNVDGCSLMPLIKGRSLQRKLLISSNTSCLMSPFLPKKIALITGEFKLIYNFPFTQKTKDYYQNHWLPPKTEKIELFDLKKDPGENRNIYTQYPELIKRLNIKLIPIIKKIRFNLKQKPKKKKSLSREEIKRLKKLGYLQHP